MSDIRPCLLPSSAARSHRGQSPVQKGDAVSIIAGDKNCRLRSDLDKTPPGVSNILLDAHMRAVFDFSEINPAAGYKLCVCPASVVEARADGHHCPDDSAFEEDIQFSVQNLMQGLDFKGATAGTSVCAPHHTQQPRECACARISLPLFCFAWQRGSRPHPTSANFQKVHHFLDVATPALALQRAAISANALPNADTGALVQDCASFDSALA